MHSTDEREDGPQPGDGAPLPPLPEYGADGAGVWDQPGAGPPNPAPPEHPNPAEGASDYAKGIYDAIRVCETVLAEFASAHGVAYHPGRIAGAERCVHRLGQLLHNPHLQVNAPRHEA